MTAKKRCTAVILAAGSGSRMKSNMAKQFMPLCGKPLICYALEAVEHSEVIDDCILVTGVKDIVRVTEEIVKKYHYHKVDTVIAGGEERYASVASAMRLILSGDMAVPNRDGYVFVHDGARPFLTENILKDTYEAVRKYGACVSAVRSKDTIKIADKEGFVKETPNRNDIWNIHTPQVFRTELITAAYAALERNLQELKQKGVHITDDAMVVEYFTDHKVKLVEGSYENIKLTTPEDLVVAEKILEKIKNEKNKKMC
ncbi:MAG: 2-C-methyl-D-erythritol 4-phosphate cytidylyltransferase [Lachnospiraceae bacterium]|jgi:2-C-methyl-D-erythritol 4-phosphate cytidylyltransferase|nr:2-C-methyl-D-erythritol 4-phosphate cytidylyltransferase [Lachnospiraceae bacterium]